MIWDYEVTYYGPEYLCVGIDFGIKHYLTLSTGKMYGRPHFFSGCKREMTEERKAGCLNNNEVGKEDYAGVYASVSATSLSRT